jgi:RNA polymerase-associated protein RTF1
MEGLNAKLLMTDQYLVTGYGKIEKEYPLIACSDSKFTDVEFDRWKLQITEAHLRQLTHSKIKVKIDDINFLLKHDWTANEIQQKLDKQNRLSHMIRHTRTSAVGPETLRREEQLHHRNMENRRQNAKDVHEALLRERRERKARNDKIRKEMDDEQRRRQDPEAEAKYLEEEEKKRKEKEALQKSLQKRYVKDAESYRKGGALTEFARMRTDDEVIGSLDLDIDIDIC